MLPLFFAESITRDEFLTVEGDEAHHAIKVVRIEVGEELLLVDGTGLWAQGRVHAIDKKFFTLEVRNRGEAPEPQQQIIVIQALMKSDHAKQAIELLTVAGADRIIPWQSERSIAKWQSDLGGKWRATAIAACKQSRRIRLPIIENPITTHEIVSRFSKHNNLLVLHEGACQKMSELKEELHPGPIVIVVGAEGGISDDELELFANSGAKVLLLGDPDFTLVFRSAHAGFAAISALSALIGRW